MTIAFAHYRNTPNIGDLMCAPYHYFDFPDKAIYDLSDTIPPCDTVIYGGGAIEPKLRTDRIQDSVQAERKIAWGIGTSRRNRKDHGPLVDDLDLCGVREMGREEGVPNAFYVPCVSAMSSLFDSKYEITQDVVFYTHGVYGLPDSGPAPRLNNRANSLEDAIRFIASGETVVTNSFHGTYWATLLGRKVVCIPFSSKFYGFAHPPSYCQDGDWASAAETAQSYPEALGEARKHNLAFYERVQNLINSSRAGATPSLAGASANTSRDEKGNVVTLPQIGRQPREVNISGRDNVLMIEEGAELAGARISLRGNRNKIAIGKNSIFKGSIIIKGNDCTLTIGDRTDIVGARVTMSEGTTIAIGSDCLFSRNIEVRTTDEHPIYDLATRERVNASQNVHIGDRVWVGEGARILKGAQVPSGSVVGTMALISKTLPEENAIYAGVPARLIRSGIRWSKQFKDLDW